MCAPPSSRLHSVAPTAPSLNASAPLNTQEADPSGSESAAGEQRDGTEHAADCDASGDDPNCKPVSIVPELIRSGCSSSREMWSSPTVSELVRSSRSSSQLDKWP